jgi:hypothetical protein
MTQPTNPTAPANVVADFGKVEQTMAEAAWRTFSFGVRLRIRPQTGLLSATVEAQISRDLYLLHQGEDVLSRYGFDPDEVGLLAEPDIGLGFAMMIRATAKGLAMIEAWNLVDADQVPIDINAETVRKLFHLGPIPGAGPVLMMEFQTLCDTPGHILAAEKNGFGSSSNGGTAGEPNTAKVAANSETPAPLVEK